ncbi:MAG: DUF1700 domain-containing protein [Lachnospiraceae bacterium]|nr:DUF1700 domain-containing protein [Lachnospiraceae bacterium]
MNKQQFLNELRQCLEGEVSGRVINENIAYYNQYFDEQMAAGKSEMEVAQELGNPILTARTIIEAAETGNDDFYEETVYTEDGEEAPHSNTQFKSVEIKWYHKLIFALVIIAVISLIVTVTGAILSFLAPVLGVVLLIYLVKKIFS